MERMCIASYFLLDSLTEVSYRRCYINKTNFFSSPFFVCRDSQSVSWHTVS